MASFLRTAGPPPNTWFLEPIRAHNPNGISISSAIFAQGTGTAECPYCLQWDAPFHLIIAPSHARDLDLGLTRVLNPNGISIGAAVFAGLTSVTDRPTDHATRSVTIGRIYVRSTKMGPNNSVKLQYRIDRRTTAIERHLFRMQLIKTQNYRQLTHYFTLF